MGSIGQMLWRPAGLKEGSKTVHRIVPMQPRINGDISSARKYGFVPVAAEASVGSIIGETDWVSRSRCMVVLQISGVDAMALMMIERILDGDVDELEMCFCKGKTALVRSYVLGDSPFLIRVTLTLSSRWMRKL